MTETYQIAQIDLTPEKVPERSILSTTLAQTARVKPVVFHFAAGEALTEHTSKYAANLIILSGEGTVTLGPDTHAVSPGSWIHMPPQLPHSVVARTPVIMLLEMILD